MPKMFIIAGCNGAGKTTASYTILPDMLKCDEWVNSDEIAKGLSPTDPSSVAIKASKLMMERIHELIDKREDFSIETTLATRVLSRIILSAKDLGYRITIVYFWLNNPWMAIERVKRRAASGGHFVSESTVLRRYDESINNLFRIYLPLCDHWFMIDNSDGQGQMIAEGGRDSITKTYNKQTFNLLLNYERELQKKQISKKENRANNEPGL